MIRVALIEWAWGGVEPFVFKSDVYPSNEEVVNLFKSVMAPAEARECPELSVKELLSIKGEKYTDGNLSDEFKQNASWIKIEEIK